MCLPAFNEERLSQFNTKELPVAKKQYWCGLACIVVKLMERIFQCMEIRKDDMQSYQGVANKILEIAKQQPAVVTHILILWGFVLPGKPPAEYQTADEELQRISSVFSPRTQWVVQTQGVDSPKKSKVGSKRGLIETAVAHRKSVNGCVLSICQGVSKGVRHLEEELRSLLEAGVYKVSVHSTNELESTGPKIVVWNVRHLDIPELRANGVECYKLGNTASAKFICYEQECHLNVCEEGNSVSSRPGKKNCVSETSEILRNIVDFRGRLSSNEKLIPVPKIVEVAKRVETPSSWAGSPPDEPQENVLKTKWGWGTLPDELQANILQRVEFKDLFRFKVVSKSCKEYAESDAFRGCRGAVSSESEGLFTAISYYIKNEQWRCSGFDLRSRVWRPLPSFFPALPAPDPELFKEYSVCGHGALICADIAKPPQKGRLVVLNPLTHKKRELPPLLYPRSPVLVHMWVDSVSGSFKVIVAGSSASSDEKLSRKVEVFDSEMSVWEEALELPGPKFGLNEHQVGVCVDGVLYFISFLDSGDGCRGVVAFDVKSRKWLSNKVCPILFSTYSNTLQLVETKGKVYLFSEQERAGAVDHCIDVLEMVEGNWKLRNVVREKKSGGRGLQVYPEHTCVNFGDEKLCIFNTLTRGGVVYDMCDGKKVETLKLPPFNQKGDNFFSLNPASFLLQPSFNSYPK